jgi:parvulin-like peptidyl-prolyl isomerase
MRIKGSAAWLMSSILLLGVVFGGMSSVYADTNEAEVVASEIEETDVIEEANTINVEASTIQLIHNGSKVEMQTVKYNGRLYAPIRDLCRELGCDVEASLEEKLVLLTRGSHKPEPSDFILPTNVKTLAWKMNEFQVQVRGIHTFLETLYSQGTNFVPVRYTAELLNKSVTWNADVQSVELVDLAKDPVGFVNGEPVPEYYFNYFLKPQLNWEVQQAKGGTISDEDLNRIRMQVFQSVAERVMLYQKVMEHDISLSSEDKAIINANVVAGIQNSGGMENYRVLLEQNDVNFSETVSVYQETFLINKLIHWLVMDIQASEFQLFDYYEENQVNYSLPEQRKAKHILIPFEEETEESKSEAKKLAQNILDRLNGGEDFDTLMNEFSQDPGLVNFPDGYTFSRGEMVVEFEESAFSMKPGEVSGLVETAYGYHILKLEEEIPAKPLSYEEVVEDIKAALDPRVKEEFWQHTLARWNEEMVIDFQP